MVRSYKRLRCLPVEWRVEAAAWDAGESSQLIGKLTKAWFLRSLCPLC